MNELLTNPKKWSKMEQHFVRCMMFGTYELVVPTAFAHFFAPQWPALRLFMFVEGGPWHAFRTRAHVRAGVWVYTPA